MDETQDQTAIRRQVDRLVAALRAKDLAAAGALYADDVVSFDVEPPLQHVGLAAKLENWSRVFEVFDELAYEVRNLAVVVGGEVAYGHGFACLSGTLRTGATIPGMWVRVTYGLRRTDGGWVIAHDQVSVPLDLASGRGVVDLVP